MSLHPTMNNEEINFNIDAIKSLIQNHEKWGKDYYYDSSVNEFYHNTMNGTEDRKVSEWFNSDLLS